MRRRLIIVALSGAVFVLLAVLAQGVGANSPPSKEITTLRLFDGPPEQGGSVRQLAPPEVTSAGSDPTAVLKNIPHPIAALKPGEVPADSEEARSN